MAAGSIGRSQISIQETRVVGFEPEGHWFTSDLFRIEPDEDGETNPGIYGKQLAYWIRDGLVGLGYSPEDVFPEDYCWLVVCSRTPYTLGVICINHQTFNSLEDDYSPPPFDSVKWNCTVLVEVPFWKRILGKVDTSEGYRKLHDDLRSLLQSDPRINMIDPP